MYRYKDKTQVNPLQVEKIDFYNHRSRADEHNKTVSYFIGFTMISGNVISWHFKDEKERDQVFNDLEDQAPWKELIFQVKEVAEWLDQLNKTLVQNNSG